MFLKGLKSVILTTLCSTQEQLNYLSSDNTSHFIKGTTYVVHTTVWPFEGDE